MKCGVGQPWSLILCEKRRGLTQGGLHVHRLVVNPTDKLLEVRPVNLIAA